MYVCLCFGVTEQQVHAQIEAGACSPRQIASACKAGTDCGGCVKRIQAMLGRPAVCPRRGAAAAETVGEAAVTRAVPVEAVAVETVTAVAPVPVPGSVPVPLGSAA